MKNVKIILTALAVALSSCNVASAMNTTSLLENIATYIPSWLPNNNSWFADYSPGIIKQGIDLVNATQVQAIKQYKDFSDTLLFGRSSSFLTNVWNLISSPFSTPLDKATIQAQVANLQGTINTNDQVMQCMSGLQSNTQATYDFLKTNAESLSKITPEYLSKNPDAKKLIQSAIETLNKPREAFTQCMSNAKADITGYQQFVVNTSEAVETLKQSLNQNKSWFSSNMFDWVPSCAKSFREAYPSSPYLAAGLVTLIAVYVAYKVKYPGGTALSFAKTLGLGLVATGTVAATVALWFA